MPHRHLSTMTPNWEEYVADPQIPQDIYHLLSGGAKREEIRQAVLSLPEPHRSVLACHYGLYEGEDALTLGEIARGLNISWVKCQRIHREGLEMARERLEGQDAASHLSG